ncbi:hypothetical protein B0H16DRAFT_1447310 [Mycena metata]|uniref:Uncharacterized protein n=1 Tax=Mycena metata TaxID=1033252 RepID=A0AAD7KDK6_9AGAR|nr:hypothetical protein B0H16DRAFT_1447310 [Mycena metata]
MDNPPRPSVGSEHGQLHHTERRQHLAPHRHRPAEESGGGNLNSSGAPNPRSFLETKAHKTLVNVPDESFTDIQPFPLALAPTYPSHYRVLKAIKPRCRELILMLIFSPTRSYMRRLAYTWHSDVSMLYLAPAEPHSAFTVQNFDAGWLTLHALLWVDGAHGLRSMRRAGGQFRGSQYCTGLIDAHQSFHRTAYSAASPGRFGGLEFPAPKLCATFEPISLCILNPERRGPEICIRRISGDRKHHHDVRAWCMAVGGQKITQAQLRAETAMVVGLQFHKWALNRSGREFVVPDVKSRHVILN